MTDYQKAARAKFPYGSISGDGSFAVVSKCTTPWHIRLYKREVNAEASEGKSCKAFLCRGSAEHFRVILFAVPDESTTPCE